MIKNIIFDFGDIFINLDKKAPEMALSRFGIHKYHIDDEMLDFHNKYERGLVTSENLIEYYVNKFPGLSEISFKLAWNSIILDFPEHRLEWILDLASSKKYKLFLLSNTNDLHIEQVIKNMGAIRYTKFQTCFDQFYLSQKIKLRKPDLEIYDYVLTQNKLQPQETLFIDDTVLNTMGASSLGIHTWHLKPGEEDITQLFTLKSEMF